MVHSSAFASLLSERSVAPESDGVRPSGTTVIMISSNSSLEEDSDSSDDSGTPPSGDDQ